MSYSRVDAISAYATTVGNSSVRMTPKCVQKDIFRELEKCKSESPASPILIKIRDEPKVEIPVLYVTHATHLRENIVDVLDRKSVV